MKEEQQSDEGEDGWKEMRNAETQPCCGCMLCVEEKKSGSMLKNSRHPPSGDRNIRPYRGVVSHGVVHL